MDNTTPVGWCLHRAHRIRDLCQRAHLIMRELPHIRRNRLAVSEHALTIFKARCRPPLGKVFYFNHITLFLTQLFFSLIDIHRFSDL